MPKATKLASGRWRCQYVIDGKRKSVTRDTKKEAEHAALEYSLQLKREAANITVGKAIDNYIAMKDGVLQAKTISEYKKMRNNYMSDMMNTSVRALTPEMVQKFFNEEAKRITRRGTPVSPKTLRNIHGLLFSAMAVAAPDLHLKTTLPAKQKYIVDLPSAQEVYDAVVGTNVELPVLLAMWMSFSMSEIRGIYVNAIKNGYITIKKAVVDVEGEVIEKGSVKEYERTRRVRMPDYIKGLIEQTDAWQSGAGRIVSETSAAIYCRFSDTLAKKGVQHMRFHDLRHLNASVMLMLNVPEKYALERGGWKTDNVMKNVYQHTFLSEREVVNEKINIYFENVVAHKNAHDSRSD